MAGIQIPVGIKNAAFKSGLDEMRHQARDFAKEVKGEFTGLFAGAIGGAAIVSTLAEMVEKMSKVHDQAQRFGETAETIQRVDAAAKLTGIDFEFVAKAVTTLTISANKNATALDLNKDAFAKCGISAKEFIQLPMEEKLIRLSEAYENVGGDAQKLADLTQLLGKKAADLIPLLVDGPEALRKAFEEAHVVNQANVDAIEQFGDNIEKLKNSGIPVFSFLVSILRAVSLDLKNVGDNLGVYVVDRIERFKNMLQTVQEVAAALKHGDFAGAREAGKKGQERADQIGNNSTQEIADIDAKTERDRKEIWDPSPSKKPKARPQIGDDDAAGPDKDAEAAEKAAEAHAKKIGDLQEQIAEIKRKHALEELDAEARLQELIKRRENLLTNSANTVDQEASLQMEKEALGVDEEIKKTKKEIADNAQQASDRQQKTTDELNEALADERKQNEANAFAKLDPAGQKKALEKKRNDLYGESADLEAQGKGKEAAEKRTEAAKVQADLDERARKDAEAKDPTAADKDRPSLSIKTSSLAAVGGGGGIFQGGSSDPLVRSQDNLKRSIDRLSENIARESGQTTRPAVK